MRHWRTTGNSNVAIQMGSTYISDTMTDITTIPTAKLGVFDLGELTESVNNTTSVYNIERQPEIAIWPLKPEVAIPLELQQIASKFQRQVRNSRPWWARIKCCQAIATITDTLKWQCRHQNGNTYISGTMIDRMTVPTANLGFSTTPARRNWTGPQKFRSY